MAHILEVMGVDQDGWLVMLVVEVVVMDHGFVVGAIVMLWFDFQVVSFQFEKSQKMGSKHSECSNEPYSGLL
jgi:hypothetical protein